MRVGKAVSRFLRDSMKQEPQEEVWCHETKMGIGTWSWGDRLLWSYGRDHTDVDLETAYNTSLAGGIRLFDTAEFYGFGRSERLLGRFIRSEGTPVKVCTKFVPFPWRLSQHSLMAALRKSLERLGLESLELYMMHVPLPPVSIDTWMEAMADAVEAGLIRAVGVSNYGVSQMRRAHRALGRRGVPLAANQVLYNLLQRGPERNGLQDACQELNVRLVAYSPLAQGVLTGKYTPDHPPPGIRGLRSGRQRLAKAGPLIDLLRAIGQAHGDRPPAQVALNWVIAKGALPIPGAKNARQAESNVGALTWSLTAGEVAALDQVSDRMG
jgi:aryl-alcohol dehydrogenase-like predicted oxidoreductase